MVFINEDQGKSRECSAEQCGHVYLIIIVDKSVVRLADASCKNCVNEIAREVIGALFEEGVEAGLGEESLGVGVFALRDIAQGLGEAYSGDDFVVGVPEFALGSGR